MLYWHYIIISFLIFPALFFALWAQFKVTKTFDTFSKKMATNQMTAEEVSKRILQKENVSLQIKNIRGKLTDHYNPKTKEIGLSENVYGSSSMAAIGVAAHETGHAIQDARNYFPMKVRFFVVKLSNFTSSLLLPLVGIGIMFWFLLAGTIWGEVFIWTGVGLFALGALVNFVTLPVELNASKRAVNELKSLNCFDASEISAVKKVLNAAALTYVASLAVSLIALARLVLFALIIRRD